MIPVDIELLRAATYREQPAAVLAPYVIPLSETVKRFQLGERVVLAAFVATVAHESDSFRAVVEYHDGDRYEGRKDLGNTEVGDGRKFRGKGLVQLTGRANVEACAKYFDKTTDDCLAWLVTPEGASLSAGWYFAVHRPACVRAAMVGDFTRVCRLVNGGVVGLKDRFARYHEVLDHMDRTAKPAGAWPK